MNESIEVHEFDRCNKGRFKQLPLPCCQLVLLDPSAAELTLHRTQEALPTRLHVILPDRTANPVRPRSRPLGKGEMVLPTAVKGLAPAPGRD